MEGMRQLELAWIAKRLVMVPQRAAEWCAGVGGTWWYPHSVEVSIAQDARIGDAVECHTTGQHQIARGIGGSQMARDVDHHILSHSLKRTRDVTVAVGEDLTRRARWPERLYEPSLERPQHAVLVVIEVIHVDREATSRLKTNNFAHVISVGGVAAGRQRHHRAFLEELEAEVTGNESVDHAKAIEEAAMPLPLEPIAGAREGARGRIVAIAVHDEDAGVLEWRGKEDRRV